MKTWLRLGVAAALCGTAGWAVDWKSLKSQGYVSDLAGVIDAGPKSRLEVYCAEVEHSTGVRMAFVTVSTLEGEPLEDVANALARGWGVGQPGGPQGLLFLLAIGEHRHRLYLGPGLEPDLRKARSLSTEMRPALRRRQYGEAMMAAAETLGGALAAARHTTLTQHLPRTLRPTLGDTLPLTLVLGSVGVLLWLVFAGGPRGFRYHPATGLLPWLAGGDRMGRSTWGSRGGGGFGGYDSGDKASGFGGAHCSDW